MASQISILFFYLLATAVNFCLGSPFVPNEIRDPHPQGVGILHCTQYGGVPIDGYCCPKASARASDTTCCGSTQSCVNNACQNFPCTTFCGGTCCESPNYCSNNFCLNPCPAGTEHVGTSDLCCAPQMICGNACCETDPADFADVWCANAAASFCCPSGELAVAVTGGVEGQLMCCPPGMEGLADGSCIPQVVFTVPPPNPTATL